MAIFPTNSDWAEARSKAQMITSTHEDMHAGELETSLLLHPLRALHCAPAGLPGHPQIQVSPMS